jgi:calcineurin-like phosphoesterase family protein
MNFFTSDTHFGHANIIRHCNRPFTGYSAPEIIITPVQVMDKAIIGNWNAVVNENDNVYFLGDLSFYSPERTIEIVKQLKGKKYWIVGNHDQKLIKHAELTSLFEWVRDMQTIYIQDPEATKGRNKVVLCHYPMLSWDSSYHGSWHFFGHAHGNCQHPSKVAIDVGVDCWNYQPVSYEQIKERIKNGTI